MTPEVARAARPPLSEVARRGGDAVESLRSSAGPLAKMLLATGPELLDLADTPPGVKARILADVERITQFLQLHRVWTQRIGKQIVEARRTRRGKPVRVLDVGAGAGGLLTRIGHWAAARRIPVELTGLDHDAGAVEAAKRRAGEDGRRVKFLVGDARELSGFAEGSVDVAISTFTLHHLAPGDAACVLAELDRVAAVNFFAFDLRRSMLALPLLYGYLRVGAFEAPSRHDSIQSLRKGYTLAEVRELLRAGGVENASVRPITPAFYAATRA